MMKKILFLLMMFMGVINISAQEINESQKVDSLQFQLNKLQHDYDYLYCSSDLYRLINELNIYSNNLNIKSNAILINCYHSGYDAKVYKAYKMNYDASSEGISSFEGAVYVKKMSVSLKMDESIFTEMELETLKYALNSLDAALSAAKSALNYYKVVLDIYKDLD